MPVSSLARPRGTRAFATPSAQVGFGPVGVVGAGSQATSSAIVRLNLVPGVVPPTRCPLDSVGSGRPRHVTGHLVASGIVRGVPQPRCRFAGTSAGPGRGAVSYLDRQDRQTAAEALPGRADPCSVAPTEDQRAAIVHRSERISSLGCSGTALVVAGALYVASPVSGPSLWYT